MSPASYLPIVAKNPALNIVSCYVWLRQNQTLVGVKPDSPYQSIADLKGKRIGIRNQGDTGYFGTMAMLKELGLDPAKDVEWPAVGGGGPAGQALYSGQIDAIAIWDAELARVEIAGFKLRYLPNTPGARKLFGSADGVNRTLLKEHPDWLARHFRAQAKSTIFAHANPELAVRLHWQLYPESKPKGKGEEEALKDALYILKMRMDKWFAAPWQDDKRMGASTPEEWSAWIAFTGTEDRIKDPAALFTNELIDEINAFDRGAVLEQARTLRL
jgi:NitT/TauT family transport system substrate-binding protein